MTRTSQEQNLMRLLTHALKRFDREHGRRLNRRQLFGIDPIHPKREQRVHRRILDRLCERGVIKKEKRGAANVWYEILNEDLLQTLLGDEAARSALIWPGSAEPAPSLIEQPTEVSTTQPAPENLEITEEPEKSDRELLEEAVFLVAGSVKNIVYTRDKVLGLIERVALLENAVGSIESTVKTLLQEWKGGDKK